MCLVFFRGWSLSVFSVFLVCLSTAVVTVVAVLFFAFTRLSALEIVHAIVAVTDNIVRFFVYIFAVLGLLSFLRVVSAWCLLLLCFWGCFQGCL